MAADKDILDNSHNFNFNKNKLFDPNFKFLKSFFFISFKNYSPLMHSGGSDVNSDFLIWNYFNYLAQVSIFLSRSLWKNKYKISDSNELNSLIKQFVVSLSSNSLLEKNIFMISPLLDNSLN